MSVLHNNIENKMRKECFLETLLAKCLYFCFFQALFNDASTNSGNVASRDKMISDQCIGNDVEGLSHGLI
jgi:hypothetical protein